MKTSYQTKVMLRALICSKQDLRPALAGTLIGRQGIEVYRVEKITDAKLVGSSLGVQVILVDREFPDAITFIQKLRKELGRSGGRREGGRLKRHFLGGLFGGGIDLIAHRRAP